MTKIHINDSNITRMLARESDFLRRYLRRTAEWITGEMDQDVFDRYEVLKYHENYEEHLRKGLLKHMQLDLARKANEGIDPVGYLQDKDYTEYAYEILQDERGLADRMDEVGLFDQVDFEEPPDDWDDHQTDDIPSVYGHIPYRPRISENEQCEIETP